MITYLKDKLSNTVFKKISTFWRVSNSYNERNTNHNVKTIPDTGIQLNTNSNHWYYLYYSIMLSCFTLTLKKLLRIKETFLKCFLKNSNANDTYQQLIKQWFSQRTLVLDHNHHHKMASEHILHKSEQWWPHQKAIKRQNQMQQCSLINL